MKCFMSLGRSLRWILFVLASGASFLCGLAFASQAGREHHDSDKDLNVTYQKVLAIITKPEDRRLFVEAQRSWIGFRDANVAFHGRYFPGSKGGLFVGTDMTQERTKELKILLTNDAKREHEHPFVEKITE
jgi:hypothetical protein